MDIEEFRNELIEEVKISATSKMTLDPEEFVSQIMEVIFGDGCSDFEPCFYEGETKKGKKLKIYGYDLSDFGTLSIVAAKYSGTPEAEKVSQSDVLSIAERARGFVVESMNNELHRLIEESTPAYDLSMLILNEKENIELIKIYVLTDSVKSDRIKKLKLEEVNGKGTEVILYDIENIYDLMVNKKGYVNNNIILSNFSVGGIACLKASQGDGSGYESYLCAVPGQLLSDLYEEYREQLLESNVRSYLKSSKKNLRIKGTAKNTPDMFFAYNNGISATATGLVFKETEGRIEISEIDSLQIVNGGQTTVSLYEINKKSGTDLKRVYVPMKLTVIPSDEQGEIVGKISEAANTQNQVSAADFSSNHPFHKEMHKLSRKIRAPIAPGMPYAVRWYYESARGQYSQAQLFSSKAELNKFKTENPPDHKIEKTDLAKYKVSYEGYPYTACKGKEDAHKKFIEPLKKKWETSPGFVNEQYFKEAIALAIMYKGMEKLIPKQMWFKNGFRSQIILYSLAKISSMLSEKNHALDLMIVWEKQEMPQELVSQMLFIAEAVQESILSDNKESNVSQWCKKIACWEAIEKMKLEFLPGIEKYVIREGKERWRQKTATAGENSRKRIAANIEVVNMGYDYWQRVWDWAIENNAVDGFEKDLLREALKLKHNIVPSEAKSIKILELRDKLIEYGMKI